MERIYSPKEAGKMLGITTHTIQVWDRQGRIRCLRLPTGRRRVPESEIRRLMNVAEQRKEAAYARVSSHDQKSDLDGQVKALKGRAPGAELYSDIRSGLNFKRKDLLRLLDDVLSEKVSRIYVTSEDRLARFGFDLLSWVCAKHGTEIVVVVNSRQAVSPQEELVQDMTAMITSFSAELYGPRSHKTRKLLQSVKEVTSSQ
ncbi:MAG: IS607 family transposase [Nitrososphaerota archaeon]|nr:IS607 family transposase [Nitrososphaerota archaeon]